MTSTVSASVVDAARRLRASAVATSVEERRPLGPLTTYRVGGPAAVFVTVESDAALDAVAAIVAATDVAVLVVGRGSNLLVADRGFDGVAILLGRAFERVDVDGSLVRAGGAASLPVVARRSAAAGLTGFEWAVGVPGSVGGGVRMNAGGHGADIAASLVDATVVDLRRAARAQRPAASLALAYRRSALTDHEVVVEARFRLEHGDVAVAESRLAEIVRWRREHQPGGQNAGSVFTNPAGDSAGRLIDTAGLKGHRVGSAEVSPKHANFIQADEGGSADDVFALMRVVRERVHEVHGVWLEAETRLVGFVEGIAA